MKTCIKCGSHAFNLYAEGIDQGGLCDVHYWQGRAHRAEAQPEQEPVEDVVAYHADGTRTVRIAPKRPWTGLTDEPTYTEQQIANACWAAEISDSKCESLLIALQEAAPNIGVKP